MIRSALNAAVLVTLAGAHLARADADLFYKGKLRCDSGASSVRRAFEIKDFSDDNGSFVYKGGLIINSAAVTKVSQMVIGKAGFGVPSNKIQFWQVVPSDKAHGIRVSRTEGEAPLDVLVCGFAQSKGGIWMQVYENAFGLEMTHYSQANDTIDTSTWPKTAREQAANNMVRHFVFVIPRSLTTSAKYEVSASFHH